MGGGSDEVQNNEAAAAAGAQQPVAQALEMAQYPAYMPGQQAALSGQMSHFYGAPQAEYLAMLGNNTQAAERPTLRHPTDIETYLNGLANPGGGGAPQQAAAPSAAASTPSGGVRLNGDESPLYPTQAGEYQYGRNFYGR